MCTNKTLRRRYLPTTIPICSIQIYICSAWLLTMGAQCSRILALLSSLVIQLKLSADMALRVPSYMYLSINQVKMTIQDNRKQHISKRKTLYGKKSFLTAFFPLSIQQWHANRFSLGNHHWMPKGKYLSKKTQENNYRKPSIIIGKSLDTNKPKSGRVQKT